MNLGNMCIHTVWSAKPCIKYKYTGTESEINNIVVCTQGLQLYIVIVLEWR